MEYKISDYDYIASAIGNGIFSGLTINQIWSCILLSKNREQLDAAITAAIKLQEIYSNATSK